MPRKKLIRFSLPAILLAVLATGITVLTPVVVNKDPDHVITSISVTPRSSFLGEIFTFKIEIRYPRDKVIIEPGNIEISFKPFTLVNTPKAEMKPGELIVSYKLRCLEETSCAGNKTYPISDIFVYYKDKDTEEIHKIGIKVESFYVSPQINPSANALIIRYPNEPLVTDNMSFFVGIVFGGFLAIFAGIFGFVIMLRSGKKALKHPTDNSETVNTDQFLKRIQELDDMLLRDGKPRLILTQSAGIISDYLEVLDRDKSNAGLRRELTELKKKIEIEAYRENEPSKQVTAERLRAISLLLNLKTGEENA